MVQFQLKNFSVVFSTVYVLLRRGEEGGERDEEGREGGMRGRERDEEGGGGWRER